MSAKDLYDAGANRADLLVNCRTGRRSARACSYLQRLGYEVMNLRGGILAWYQAHTMAER